jgi:hypothetical protein
MKTISVFQLNAAHEDGIRYANSLMPGLVFLGAGPAAEAKGYTRGTPTYRMFLAGALDLMERWTIRTDGNLKITEVVR